MFEEDWEKMMWKDWKEKNWEAEFLAVGETPKLYSDLLPALHEESLVAVGSLQRGPGLVCLQCLTAD